MKLWIIALVTFLLTSFLAFCNVNAIPMNTVEKLSIDAHTSNSDTTVKAMTLGHEAAEPSWNVQILLETDLIDQKSLASNKGSRFLLYDQWLLTGASAATSFNKLMKRLDPSRHIYLSYVNKIGEEAVVDIRKYLNLIDPILNSLWTCRNMRHDHDNRIMQNSYTFGQTRDLFLTENLELYKKVKQNLADITNEFSTTPVDILLMSIFNLLNRCLYESQSLSKTKSLNSETYFIDITSRNVELILEQENKKLENVVQEY